MENTLIDRKLAVLTSGVNEIRMRLPDPRRYPSAIALLQTEAGKLHHLSRSGQGWAEDKAKELDAAVRVLGGDVTP